MPKVAVVILNFNGKFFLERFLPNVIAYSSEVAELVIADNASTDDSVSFLQSHYPEIRLIENAGNFGFSTGYNLALKQIEADYYVLLNSDIEVTPHWIEPVIALMESDKQIAACQPKIRSLEQPAFFEYAGAGGGFIDKFGYPFCRGRLFQQVEEDNGQYDDDMEVFWASGACMFVRADLYHQYGGLDDSFFAHMEEIDFCWRMKNQGYKIMYTGKSAVYHIGGGTLPKKSYRKTYLNFRNNLSLLYKNLPQDQLVKIILLRLFLDGVASLKFLFQAGLADFFAVMRAHLHFYRKLPQLRKKRSMIHPQAVSRIYQKNIVFEHFILKKKHYSALKTKDFS
ncbi:MAG: glycosyltransferase family 2 protein [Bacteroidetes bacterium]|nr:glycosyltransferase family 2 protein [Bacteroidota bacterium]MBU2556329.1 glycosyltransferase family 2 protein [Bacteroidota bacterium]